MKIDIKQISFIDDKLREILVKMENDLNREFIITSMYREDSGIHGTIPLRAIDLRCRNNVMGELIKKYLNKNWKYDINRKFLNVCLYHDTGKGKHLHIQTHPNTRIIANDKKDK